MKIQLTKRMNCVASMVSEGYRLADIGCDHGYLPIALCLSGRVPSAIDMDVRTGPLECARKNVAMSGLKDKITLRLSDGMEKLKTKEVDSVIIAGMGGLLMTRLFTQYPKVTASLKELILEPQSDLDTVRKAVEDLGWHIKDEDFVEEDGKYYPVMRCEPGSSSVQMTKTELLYGPVLLKKAHPVLKEYLLKKEKQLQMVMDRLNANESDRTAARKKEITEEMQLLHAALQCYEVL